MSEYADTGELGYGRTENSQQVDAGRQPAASKKQR
jgi:hypothetical protein